MWVKMLSPRLRVIDRAAGQIAADGHANHGRRSPCAVGAPAHQRQFIANLVHGRPDVVEELNLDHRLHAAHRIADGAADDVGFGQRRVEDALRSEFGLQAGGELEDAALAFDLGERIFAAGIGHVFAVDDDARIAAHLVAQAGVDQVGHGARPRPLRRRLCRRPLRPALPPAQWRRRRWSDQDPRSRRAAVMSCDRRAAALPERARRLRRLRGPATAPAR